MLELAVVVRLGGTPVVLARVPDQLLLRRAMAAAVIAARNRAADDRDEKLRRLLDHVDFLTSDPPGRVI